MERQPTLAELKQDVQTLLDGIENADQMAYIQDLLREAINSKVTQDEIAVIEEGRRSMREDPSYSWEAFEAKVSERLESGAYGRV